MARAEPHHSWSAEFELPVFRTAASPPAPEPGAVPELAALGAAAAEPPLRPPGSRIVVHPPDADGVLIEYPATPRFVGMSLWWLLTLPLYVVLGLDVLHGTAARPLAPLGVALVVNGLPGLLWVYLWPRRLLVGWRQITLVCGLPFFGSRQRLPTSEARAVKINPKYASQVYIEGKGQTELFVDPPTKRFSSTERRWLVSEIGRALALYR